MASSASNSRPARNCLKLQIVRSRMIFQIPARHAREPLAFQRPDGAAERRRGGDPMKRPVVRRDVLTKALQVGSRRHVQSTAYPHPCRRNLEVQPRAFVPREALRREVRPDVRLERCLVLAEARVPVYAVQRGARIRDQLGREPRQIGRRTRQQLDHGAAHVPFVFGLARAKPFAVVVAFERAEKR